MYIHSTSRNIIPIRVLSNLIAQNRVKVGKCKKLKEQLRNISLKKTKDNRVYYKGKKQSIYDLFEVLLNAVYSADSASNIYPVSTYEVPTAKTATKPIDYVLNKKDDILARFGFKIKNRS